MENGKNFPSPDIIQTMVDTLDIQAYQLFLEQPIEPGLGAEMHQKNEIIVQDLIGVRQKLLAELDTIIRKYDNT